MIKIILFDVDGMVIKSGQYFSQIFAREYHVSHEKIVPFFKSEFQDCLIGKADLKLELRKYLIEWKWQKSTDDLLRYWFEHESKKNEILLSHIQLLRSKGIACYLQTNNEKYRVEYLLNTLNLKESFDGIFASAHLGCKKPEQKFWASIYEQIDKPNKAEVLVWDDAEENIESAKEFGYQAELFTDFSTYMKLITTALGN